MLRRSFVASQTQATLAQTYTFRASARDEAGNTGPWTETGVFEISPVTKYYLFGEQRVAMRQGDQVYYLHGDHLGSTSLTTDENGTPVSEVRYLPYGEERWSDGATPTDFGFTSQRNEASFGLMDHNARYYSPGLGRFVSPDTIVPEPGSSQGWNRYSYVVNNPLKYVDSDGHCYGFASGLRNTFYSTTCNNLDMATVIVTSPDATIGQKMLAGGYVGLEALAHGALIVGGAGVACGSVAPCAAAVEPILGIGAAACADTNCGNEVQLAARIGEKAVEAISKDGDPTNELKSAIDLGSKAIEATTNMEKIASQLQSKSSLLNVKVSGNMQSLNNPQVQKGLTQLNNITANPDRIWKGTWTKHPVYEYIQGGIGVVRDQTTGALISVTERVGPHLQKLQDFVNNGTAEWLK